MRCCAKIRGIQNGPHMGRTFAEVLADRRSLDWQRDSLVAQQEMIQCTMRVTPDELPRYIEQYERQQAEKKPPASE